MGEKQMGGRWGLRWLDQIHVFFPSEWINIPLVGFGWMRIPFLCLFMDEDPSTSDERNEIF